jgi:hypothetical protein
MRAFVFTNPTLRRHAGQFVWLSINTEKAENVPALAKYPVKVWPTFFVVDPKTETVSMRWVGGATAGQLTKLFDEGSTIGARKRGIEEALVRADRLFGAGQYAEAAREYAEVVKRASPTWGPYRRTAESLLMALDQSDQKLACADWASDLFPKVAETSSSANVAAVGLDCALAIPETNLARPNLVAALALHAREVLEHPPAGIAADDLSSLYDTLASERRKAKDEEGRKRVAADWAAFLERQASLARTPEERAVFDSHRLSAYIALEEAERAIPMLEASERDLPGDYNPPARLAVAYRELKRYDEALAASSRALSKAYGPRKLGILQNRAEILARMGNTPAARETLEEAIRTAESLPVPQRSQSTLAALKKRLDALRGGNP